MPGHLTPILPLNCLQYTRVLPLGVDLGSENIRILKSKRLCSLSIADDQYRLGSFFNLLSKAANRTLCRRKSDTTNTKIYSQASQPRILLFWG